VNIYIFEIVDLDNKTIDVAIKAPGYLQALAELRAKHKPMLDYKLINELIEE
jgi:hypothetical protein